MERERLIMQERENYRSKVLKKEEDTGIQCLSVEAYLKEVFLHYNQREGTAGGYRYR